MQPSDIVHLRIPSSPVLHPDGQRVAYVLSRPDTDKDRYHTQIRLWDGEVERAFTHGPSDANPRWSPDGRWLAFLRKGEAEDAKAQLVIMPADGGEAQVRTDLPLGVSDLAWAPDSDRLVIVGATWIDDLADLEPDERKRRPRRITRLPYRGDNQGWVHERRNHLYLVDREGDAEPRCLTPGDDFEETSPQWRPDGRAIAFVSARHAEREVEPGGQPFELDLDTEEVRALAEPGYWLWAGYDPDGTIHLLGIDDQWGWPGVLRLYRHDGEGRPTDLTGNLDRSVLAGLNPAGVRFLKEGVLAALEGRGVVDLHRLDNGQAAPVATGQRVVTGFDADDTTVVFTASWADNPGELVVLRDGEEEVVTDWGGQFRAEVDVRPTTQFTFPRDGVDLDVWVVTPAGFNDADPASVPVLLNIHGGPTAQYDWGFFDEWQVYAAAGYLVVGTNPRGSSGRGQEWCRAVVGTWDDEDSVDMLDLRAVVDATLERYAQADPDRVGIMGGSYGGYATARIIARDHRFKSAIVERGLLVWPSFSGTSDIGPYFDRMFLGLGLDDGGDEAGRMHQQASPVRTAHRVTTPTLVLHAENDFRCPIEQGEQYFTALKRAGVTTEMVRFPDEGHELSRSGTPKHRIERFDIILDWHQRHLS